MSGFEQHSDDGHAQQKNACEKEKKKTTHARGGLPPLVNWLNRQLTMINRDRERFFPTNVFSREID
jgi:hypothetical protein